MDADERKLVLAARQGDERAFEALVRGCDRRIMALAWDMLGDREDACDLFQEVLLTAHRALPCFRLESSFSTWIYRIAIHQALKFRRRRGRSVEEVPEPARERDPEDHFLAAELRGQCEKALEALSPRERLAFALCHHQGFAIGEAAACMGCSEGSVKSYLFRAREKMRQALVPYLEE